MERAYQKRSPGRSRTGRAVNEAIQLMLDPVELIGQLQESVHTIGVEIGRVVALVSPFGHMPGLGRRPFGDYLCVCF